MHKWRKINISEPAMPKINNFKSPVKSQELVSRLNIGFEKLRGYLGKNNSQ